MSQSPPQKASPTASGAAAAKKLAFQIRLSIGTKLVGLIAILLMSSVVSLVWLSTRMFIEDNTALIQQMNADTAGSLALQSREYLESLTEKMRILGTLLMQSQGGASTAGSESEQRVVSEFFAKDKDLLAVFLHATPEGTAPQVAGRALSPEMKSSSDPEGETLLAGLASDREAPLAQSARGEIQIGLIRLADDSGGLAISVPFVETAPGSGKFGYVLTAFVKQARFARTFGESAILTTFLVDRKGRLLVHSDPARSGSGESLGGLGIVKRLLESQFNNEQTRYLGPSEGAEGEWKLGAYRRVGFAGLAVVAEVAEAKAFETSKKVQFRSMLVAAVILCLSFLMGFLYSGTITWPIKELVAAANRISQGDFKIALRPKSRDEVPQLSLAFNDMAQGLEERDRVKATFSKFHSKEIAEKLLSGEVRLGGERREAVIFFSDVRGFTAMSETMEPEQVVEMLNEYMTRMVAVIQRHSGIVDKYVGDAIMAIWGVPLSTGNDAENAVRACLGMRQELAELNKLRLSRGQNELKIGMGLNMGPVIAGNIGSDQKMEYTVIGDSVNLASRMESMTKEYGTDLLIPRVIQQQLEGKFVFEQCKSAKVKGKSTAIEIFKVKGIIDEQGRQVLIETPYSSYEAEKSDKVVHDEPKETKEPQAAEAPAETPPIAPEPSELARALTPPPPPPPPLPPQMEKKEEVTATHSFARNLLDDATAQIQMPPPPKEEPTSPLLGPAFFAPTPNPEETDGPTLAGADGPSLRLYPLSASAVPARASSARYLNWNGEILGPFTEEEVRDGLTRGEFPLSVQVGPSAEGPWETLDPSSISIAA